MGEIKNQKVVVILTMTDSDKNLIGNGIQLATIFKKELFLLVHNQNHKTKIPDHC